MKPIKTKTLKTVRYEEVHEEWTYEDIMELWHDESQALAPMLAKRCKELEERIDQVYALMVRSYINDVDLEDVKSTLYGDD